MTIVENIEKLQMVADKFLEDNFMFVEPVTVQLSEDTARAQHRVRWDGKSFIEFNHKAWIEMNMANNKKAILNTLIHECLHHALYCQEDEYRDGDLYFEQELINFGANSNFEDYELEEMFGDDIDNIYDRDDNFERIKKIYLKLL